MEKPADVVLPTYYLRQFGEQLRAMGVSPEDWLAHSGLDAGGLEEASVSLDLAGFRQLLANAQALTGEPGLGLLVGERLHVNTHGMLGFAAMNTGSIRQAVELLERFFPLRTGLVQARGEVRGGDFLLLVSEAVPLLEVRHLVVETVVLALKNVLDYITLGSCPVRQVAFAHPAHARADLARELFQCEVRYGQKWSGLRMPRSALDRRLKLADPDAFRHACAICERELEKMQADASLAQQVRRLLVERRAGFPSLQATARLFHMTPRTLHRRLRDEGTSFRSILEEVRHTLALEYLKSGQLSIQEIAYDLGYRDVANFRRAFKRWEHVPPSALAGGGEPTDASGDSGIPARAQGRV